MDTFAELEAELDQALGLAPPPSTSLAPSKSDNQSDYCELIASLQSVGGEGGGEER